MPRDTPVQYLWLQSVRCFRFVTMHTFDGQADGRTDVDSKTVRMLRSRTVKSYNQTYVAKTDKNVKASAELTILQARKLLLSVVNRQIV